MMTIPHVASVLPSNIVTSQSGYVTTGAWLYRLPSILSRTPTYADYSSFPVRRPEPYFVRFVPGYHI